VEVIVRDSFVKLLADFEQIALNQIGTLEPGLSADEVITAYKQVLQHMKIQRKDIETILNDHLYPLLDDIDNMSDGDEAELYALAQKLSSYAVAHDPGLALRIYTTLLEYARRKQDDARKIKYLYWCGITLYFFFRKQMEKILEYFEEGASYCDRYYEFNDPETRRYIHRCMGNASMSNYHLGELDEGAKKAMALEDSNFCFWNSILFTGKDADFPWLNYFLSCLNHRHSYLTHKVHKDPDSESKPALRMILDNAITMNKLYRKNRDSFSVFGGSRYDFILWEAQFLSGLISFDHLYENVHRRKAEFAPDDFSSDAMYVKIHLSSYLMYYAAKMHKLRDRKITLLESESREVTKQFSLIPMSVSPVSVSGQLQDFAVNLSDILSPVEQMDFVLKMSVYRHIPTYAHSIVTGKIAQSLAKHLVESSPEYFTGCMGLFDAGDIGEQAPALCDFAYTSGLCHDIGKIAYVCNPYMQARVLTKEEFEVLKQHPDDGAALLKRDDDSALAAGYIDVIRGHHKFYDNSGGYPADFDREKSKYLTMIDIISVADSIDIATDDIGATYVNTKSLETLREEIITEAGSRYSPVVADALKDEAVYAEINRILDIDRREAYYTAYLHAWAGRNQE